jgi:hypothetical protein
VAALILISLLEGRKKPNRCPFVLLVFSMLCNVLAIIFGFLVKGALIGALDAKTSSVQWNLGRTVEVFSLLQAFSTLFGFIFLAAAFAFCHSTIVAAARKIWGK